MRFQIKMKRQSAIDQAKTKLEEYDELINTLEAHYVKSLKDGAEENMVYIKEILGRIAK